MTVEVMEGVCPFLISAQIILIMRINYTIQENYSYLKLPYYVVTQLGIFSLPAARKMQQPKSVI